MISHEKLIQIPRHNNIKKSQNKPIHRAKKKKRNFTKTTKLITESKLVQQLNKIPLENISKK